MKFKYQIITGILVVLGVIIARSIYPLLGSLLDNSKANDVSKLEITNYIGNSKEITLNFKEYHYSKLEYTNFLYTNNINAWTYTFYDIKYKKYFSIERFELFVMNDILDNIKNHNIECTVNNFELNSLIYGTRENPIPIFKCNIPVDNYYKIYMENYNKEYEISILKYLKYFKSKESFKQMFPKNEK